MEGTVEANGITIKEVFVVLVMMSRSKDTAVGIIVLQGPAQASS